MKGQIAVVIEFGVGPLLETIAEDDDAAAGRDLQVEFDMPMAEDIVVAVGVLFLLLFGKKHQLFLVFSLVGTRLRDLFQTTPFCPFITEFITPTRR